MRRANEVSLRGEPERAEAALLSGELVVGGCLDFADPRDPVPDRV